MSETFSAMLIEISEKIENIEKIIIFDLIPERPVTNLSDKQQRFCEEYLIDLNATQAAIRAGYSKKSAEVQGSRMLSYAKVSSRISELQKQRSERTVITADFVLTGLKEVAERCLQRAPVMKWDYEEKAMMQIQDDEGKYIWEFDSQGANRAFELLGKHIGIFEKDNNQRLPVTIKMV